MKKKIIKSIAMLFMGLLLTSCGFFPHDVTIQPDLPVEEKNIGKNKSMLISVDDDRPQKSIGHRTYQKTGKISLSEEQEDRLAADIKLSIEEGFNKLGFNIIQSGLSDRNVSVDIRLIEYEGLFGLFTVGSMSRAAFKVTSRLPSGREFENIYRVEHEHRSLIIPTSGANEKWLNEVVSEALMRMFDDREFMDFLSSEK